jgi:segregation and condensation protein B
MADSKSNPLSENRNPLPALQSPPSDTGLSLDQLTQAFAQLLSGGQDPYAASATPDDAGLDDEQPGEFETSAADSDAHCETTPRSILEAMLFVGNRQNEPLIPSQVASLMRGVRPAEIEDLVRDLNREYEANRCPYRIVSEGAGFRLVLRQEFHALRDKFYGRVQHARLSQAAVEVLSLVAYNGSLSGEEVAKLRGKPTGAILAQLVRRQLLALEREEPSSREVRYRPTQRFLDLFGLERLEDLPRSQELDVR